MARLAGQGRAVQGLRGLTSLPAASVLHPCVLRRLQAGHLVSVLHNALRPLINSRRLGSGRSHLVNHRRIHTPSFNTRGVDPPGFAVEEGCDWYCNLQLARNYSERNCKRSQSTGVCQRKPIIRSSRVTRSRSDLSANQGRRQGIERTKVKISITNKASHSSYIRHSCHLRLILIEHQANTKPPLLGWNPNVCA